MNMGMELRRELDWLRVLGLEIAEFETSAVSGNKIP